jgi:hypothetical protein
MTSPFRLRRLALATAVSTMLSSRACMFAVLVVLLGSSPLQADLVFGTLRTGSNGYGFGSFDISNPTGSPGSYSYAWTAVLSNQTALADLARDPNSGAMYLMFDPYGVKSYRSITTGGVMTSLGTPTDRVYSMAIDNTTGELFAYAMTAPSRWQKLDEASGSTLTSGSLTGAQTSPYASVGGNMTGSAAGGFYFASEFPGGQLVQITPSGTNASTVITGTMTGTGFNSTKASIPFVSGTSLHVLNENRLYSVDQTNAALTLLGTVTGLPGDFMTFSGAVAPVTIVPEPTTLPLAVSAGLGFAAVRFRRRHVWR